VATAHGLDLTADIAEATKCLSFELTFDSSFVDSRSDGVTTVAFTHQAKATVPIRFQAGKLTGRGAGAISITSITFSGPSDCSGVGTPGEAVTFTANLLLAPDLEKFNGPATMSLLYNPGNPPSTLNVTCGGHPLDPVTDHWREDFDAFHQDELAPGLDGVDYYFASGWSASGGRDPWATRNYARGIVDGGSAFHETTTLKLAHTPD
jgi:hypothetical protein